MADFFWFSDSHWARIEPHLPMDVRGKKRVDDRRVLSGIVHALKCGGRWADCADVYGPKKTLYNRCALGRARHLGGYLQCAGRHPGYTGPAIHRQQLHQGPPMRRGWKRGEWLDARGTEAVIPPRKTRKTQYNYDKAIYKQRNIIERMFCRFKDWRRIATRFDRNLSDVYRGPRFLAIYLFGL